MKNILFDMDGTLYWFENWQYSWSKLENEVKSNVKKLLQDFEWENYLQKFNEIEDEYIEEFSIAFQELYNISKEDFFNKTWDVNPEWIINNNRNVKEVFNILKSLWYDIYIVSESPKIWIYRVITYLEINSIISWIYSWQWDERKYNWLLYEKIKSEIGEWLIMVWDQEKSDIIMANKNGIKSVFISDKWIESKYANYNITDLIEIVKIIE